MKNKQYVCAAVAGGIILLSVLAVTGTALAAEAAGEYLQYHEPKASYSSGWSAVGYVFSLLLTFGAVIALAYFASRIVGQKMANNLAKGNDRVLTTLPLGTNRGLYVVEIAGKFLVLGVTEHSITVLQEVTDAGEMERLRAEYTNAELTPFDKVLQQQLASLQRLTPKFPNSFAGRFASGQQREEEKR